MNLSAVTAPETMTSSAALQESAEALRGPSDGLFPMGLLIACDSPAAWPVPIAEVALVAAVGLTLAARIELAKGASGNNQLSRQEALTG